jgi:hypothetical protein
MFRLSLIAAFAGLLFCGCGQTDGVVADQAAAEGVAAAGKTTSGETPAGKEEVKTPLVRALLQTLDEAKGESPEVKDSLKQTLLKADRDLAKVLGGKSKLLIMKANQKPPTLVIGEPGRPRAKKASGKAGPSGKTEAGKPNGAEPKKPSASGPESQRPAGTPPRNAPAGDQGLKSPMVRALMQAVDEAKGEPDESREELKKLLRQVDKELSDVLGGKSQRLILKANKKPPVPVVCEPGPHGAPGAKVRSLKGVKVLEFNRTESKKP